MVKDSSVFGAISRFGVAGYPLAANEGRDVARLCETGKLALMEFAHDLIHASDGRPLLFEYVGDGTPVKLKHAFQVAFAEHHQSHRSGYTGVELYCQGAFLRSLDSAGSPVVRTILRDPRPMAGKSGLHAFNAVLEFFLHWMRLRMSGTTSTITLGIGHCSHHVRPMPGSITL